MVRAIRFSRGALVIPRLPLRRDRHRRRFPRCRSFYTRGYMREEVDALRRECDE